MGTFTLLDRIALFAANLSPTCYLPERRILLAVRYNFQQAPSSPSLSGMLERQGKVLSKISFQQSKVFALSELHTHPNLHSPV